MGSKLPHEASEQTRRRAEERAERSITQAAKRLEMTEKEVIAKVEDRLKEDLAQSVAIRLSSKSAFRVAEDGRFKTQHETGTSVGEYDPEMRLNAEKNGLGVPVDIPVEERPVYGYFRTEGNLARDYGSVELVLKDSAKERMTYTLGDSLVAFDRQELVGGKDPKDKGAWDGDVESYMRYGTTRGKEKELTVPDDPAFKPFHKRYAGVAFIEAQIQGGVSLADVERVVIHRGTGSRRKLAAVFEEKGVKVVYGR